MERKALMVPIQKHHIPKKPIFKNLSQHNLDKYFPTILAFAKMRNYYFRKVTEKYSRFREDSIMTGTLTKKRLSKKQFKSLRSIQIEPCYPSKENGFLEYLKIANCLKVLRICFGDGFTDKEIHEDGVRAWMTRFPKSISIIAKFGKGENQGAIREYRHLIRRLPKLKVSDVASLTGLGDLPYINKIDNHLCRRRTEALLDEEKEQKMIEEGVDLTNLPPILVCRATTSILAHIIFSHENPKGFNFNSTSQILYNLSITRTYYQSDFDQCPGLRNDMIYPLKLDFYYHLIKLKLDFKDWEEKDLSIIDTFGAGFGHLTNLHSLKFKLANSKHWTARHTEKLLANCVRIPAKLKKFKFKTPTMMSESEPFLFLAFFRNQTELENFVWKFTGPWDQLTSNFWQCFSQSFLTQYLANLKKLKKVNINLPLPLSIIINLLNGLNIQLQNLKLKCFDFDTNGHDNEDMSEIPELQLMNLFFTRQKDSLKEFCLNYKTYYPSSLFHLRNAIACSVKLEKIILKIERTRQQQQELETPDLDSNFLTNFPKLEALKALTIYLWTNPKECQFSPKHRFQFLQCLNKIPSLRHLCVRGITKDLYEKYQSEMEMITFSNFKHLSTLVFDDKGASIDIQNKSELYSLSLLCRHEFA